MAAAADHRREGAGGECWVEDWNTEMKQSNSMGRLTRDVRRQERTDMRNRFLSIDMDAKVWVGRCTSYATQLAWSESCGDEKYRFSPHDPRRRLSAQWHGKPYVSDVHGREHTSLRRIHEA